MKAVLFRLLLTVVVTTVLASCATSPKIVQPEKRFFWPPEPEQPRIEWISTYYGDLDVKKPSLLSFITGEDSTINFARPISVAGDGEGRFVVSDQEAGQAFMFDLNKNSAVPLGGSSDAAVFKKISGVTVDGEGNFYVADAGSKKVFVVNGENNILRILDLSEDVKLIGYIAIDRARSRLIVPDAVAKQVLVYSLTGKLLSKVGSQAYFAFPNAAAVTSDGSILVADSFNAHVVKFSVDGKYLSVIGRRGDSPGDLTLITGIAVDSEDHVYVTDGRLHNLTIFDKDGNTLLVIGGLHSIRSGNVGRGGFQIPHGVGIDKNDRIYIADSFNKRLQVFQYLNERYLREHPIELPKP